MPLIYASCWILFCVHFVTKNIKRNTLIFKFGNLTLIFKLGFREERKILYKNKEICIKIFGPPILLGSNGTFKNEYKFTD
jgi:hypothetical protein